MGRSSSRKHRIIDRAEMHKRGCVYCPYYTDGRGKNHIHVHWCSFGECPYHELDEYKNYSDYLKVVAKEGEHNADSRED